MANEVDEEWEEWEEDDYDAKSCVKEERKEAKETPAQGAVSPRKRSSQHSPRATQQSSQSLSFAQEHTPVDDPPKTTHRKDIEEDNPADVNDWKWDWNALEQEAQRIPTDMTFKPTTTSHPSPLWPLIDLAEPATTAMERYSSKLSTLWALAVVNELQLGRFQRYAIENQEDTDQERMEMERLMTQLTHLAGPWADRTFLVTQLEDNERTQLDELTSLLHSSLAAVHDGDLTPFQQVLEQVFASFSSNTITIPVHRIRPSFSSSDNDVGYFNHLLQLCQPNPRTIPPLTDAQKFQDAKDIKRDEVLVNGTLLVGGSVGYDAIIKAIQEEIHRLLVTSNCPEAHTLAVAEQIVNACNRTESGGFSYEILSAFVSKHEMDHVLIRPTSSKAPPLTIALDLGPYLESLEEDEWNFGIRVQLSAITWYWICDARDPTRELYEVQVTYKNQLAFPLHMTAFHPIDQMRKDAGRVEIQLMVQKDNESPKTQEAPIDCDSLLG